MINGIGVSFNDEKNIIYCDANEMQVKKDIAVVVETDRGLQFGQVVVPELKMKKQNNNKIVRVATKKDKQKYQQNMEEALNALKMCNELVSKHKLNMNIISSDFTFDKKQLLFKFTADNRIDFRILAKELATIYKTRIELRQIGIRDKAKEIGGYGSCGQKLCCSRFNTDFSAVSINMAKNQNLSLNPSKINGVCGRLLCCLKYEDDNYKECRKCVPKLGSVVDTNKGKGKVINVDVLNKKYQVQVENEIIEMGACCGNNQ